MQVRGVGRVKRIGVIGVAVCGALLTGGISPVWAGEPGPGSPPMVELGSFSVGDGLEGVVNEADGSFGVVLPVAGLSLSWDSRVGVDRYGLGTGWGYGLAVVDVLGGVRVRPSSGGVFEAAESVSSGLLGYAGGDVRFRQTPDGVLAARADGVVGARGYAFELHELGGVITYFDAAGDPIALVAANGDRSDWTWADGEEHRLTSIVSVDGVSTELDWTDPADVVVRPGANVPADGGGTGQWRVKSVDGRVAEVLDPVGGRSRAEYDRSGRVVRVVSGSGAVTQVVWRSDADGVSRVDRVGVADPDGVELSARSWRQIDGVLPSGWPVEGSVQPGAFSTAMGGDRSVEVSDGHTRVVSGFDAWGRLANKRVVVSTSAGERVIQEQELTYPEGDPVGVGDPVLQPVVAEVGFRGPAGDVRVATESYAYDELGRMVRRSSADGTVLEREYDSAVPEDRLLPVGRAMVERSTAPDGSVMFSESQLDVSRTLPVLVEQGLRSPGADRVVTARTEYAVEAAVIVERRAYPGGDLTGDAVVTRWDQVLDLGAGVRKVSETVAAGTELAVTRSSTASLVHGGALVSTDVLGHSSSASYDAAGRPVAMRDVAGRVTATAYDRVDGGVGGDRVTVTGPEGVAVSEVRDVLGRVVSRYDNLDEDGFPADGVMRVFQRHAFPAPGVEEVTDAWGAVTRTELDVYGRPMRTVFPNGVNQVTDHDDVAGTVTSGSTLTGRLADAERLTTSRMDLSGRVIGTDGVRADGIAVPVTSSVYDGFGREIESSDGRVRRAVEFDAAGHPVTTTIGPVDPADSSDSDVNDASLIASRRFDVSGASLEKIMSVGGRERSGGSRQLDLLGRTVLETDQAGATTRYEYTLDGLIERITSSTGQVAVSTFDPATRQLTETRVERAGETIAIGYAYDEVTGRLLAVFDPSDRAGTEITYTYDGHGNTRTVRYPATSERPAATIVHHYDRHGRKTGTTDIAGNRTLFAYAPDGFLAAVVQSDAAGEEMARVGYTPDSYGRVQQLTHGNGVVTEYEFTSAGQIETETSTGPDGTLHAARDYEYEPATGNLIARTDRTAGEASGDLVVERREYAYDHLGRLTASTIREGDAPDAPVVQSVGYEITVSGQVATESTADASGRVTRREFAYSPTGALETITTTHPDGVTEVAAQEHDEAGNLTRAADGTEYEWDALDRQTGQTLPGGERIDSSYWPDGTRRARGTAAGSTTYYWDGAALINEVHTTPAPAATGGIASYLLGSTRHARTTHTEASETQYYETDRHGNVTALTDQAGAITGTYAYTDYGIATLGPGITGPAAGMPGAAGQVDYNPFQYALEYSHPDGTQFLRERTYDPAHLGFTSKDREALHDQYGYANANPIMLVDPTGRYAAKDGAAIFLNGLGILGGFVAATLAFGSALSGGGLGLMVLGVGAGIFSAADAVFTGVEVASLVTETRFMSESLALGVGIGLALAGTLLTMGADYASLASRAARGAHRPAASGVGAATDPGPPPALPPFPWDKRVRTSAPLETAPVDPPRSPLQQAIHEVDQMSPVKSSTPETVILDARVLQRHYNTVYEGPAGTGTPFELVHNAWLNAQLEWAKISWSLIGNDKLGKSFVKNVDLAIRRADSALTKPRIDEVVLPKVFAVLSDGEAQMLAIEIKSRNVQIDSFLSNVDHLYGQATTLEQLELGGTGFADALWNVYHFGAELLKKY